MRRAVAATLLCLASATSLGAQTIVGVVRDRGDGGLLRGVFVSVVDSSGNARRGVLTDSVGRYVLRAPVGTVRIRAELIGYQTILKSVAVPATGAAAVDFVLGVEPIVITGLHAQATRRCTTLPEAAQQTARIWAEVRKALRVASWAQRQQPVRLETRSYERTLDPGTLAVLHEVTQLGESTNKAYSAIEPDTLARYGYVRTIAGDSTLYYGPDADVLLSDSFLDTHCFSVVLGTERNTGFVGLSFKPVAHRKLQDITGTLWLNPQTSELQYIEFSYTNLPRPYDFPGVGGETHFLRMRNGAWIVQRWFIRLPISVQRLRDYSLKAYSEAGGEVVGVKQN